MMKKNLSVLFVMLVMAGSVFLSCTKPDNSVSLTNSYRLFVNTGGSSRVSYSGDAPQIASLKNYLDTAFEAVNKKGVLAGYQQFFFSTTADDSASALAGNDEKAYAVYHRQMPDAVSAMEAIYDSFVSARTVNATAIQNESSACYINYEAGYMLRRNENNYTSDTVLFETADSTFYLFQVYGGQNYAD